MNKRIDFDDFWTNVDFFLSEAKKGKTFVYPTDTVYGMGAIPNNQTIKKIYEIKNRSLSKPFSIIAPNIDWIKTYFVLPKDFDFIIKDAFEKYHGVTFILTKKDKNWQPLLGKDDRVGVRLLKHKFQDFVNILGDCFITTSANISQYGAVDDLNSLHKSIFKNVDYVIDGGKLYGKPSVLIDLDSGKHLFRTK